MPINRKGFLGSLTAAAGAALFSPHTLGSEIAKLLLTSPAGAGLENGSNALDPQKFRAAVTSGDIETVRHFLERNPALRFNKDDHGRSVFILAHLAGHPEIAALFTKLGLELDLVEASVVGDWDRVTEVGQATPRLVNADHPIGGTAMYAAALFGHGTPMFRLNTVGGDPNGNPRGKSGITPVRAAMNCKNHLGAERAATYLIGNGGDVNAPQERNDTVLHGAVRCASTYLVEYVLRKGGRAEARNDDGHTPLDIARAAGHAEIVDLLQNHRRIRRDMARDDPASSRWAYDASGGRYRPLDYSHHPAVLLSNIVGVSHNDLGAVKELTGKYPELIHAKATTDEMAVEASAHMRLMADSVRYYLDHGAPLSLPTCLRLGMKDRARELLRENRQRINERGPHDFALTYYPTIGGGRVDAATVLVEFGVDVNAEGQLGETGLHWAARSGHGELAEYWIQQGADLNARTRDSHLNAPGATPLDFAQAAGQDELVKLLKSRGGRSLTIG